MHPADALDRIVYLLDRVLAEGQKVKAFARARDVVLATDDDELVRLHRLGKLTDLAGVGPTTGKVIAEALDGGTPGYLAELEETTVLPVGEGAGLRAALRGDCHTHSTWSDGGAPIEKMARTAIALGHEYMVLTDHSPRLTVARGLTAERLRAQLDEVDGLNEALAPFRILTGIEVDILPDGELDQREDLLARLDVVVGSVHSKLRMERAEMTRRMVAAAQFDTALEINCRPERQDPPDDLVELALDWGLRFAVDTDAHAPGQMEWQVYGCDKAARHGIDPDRIVNTMAADDLVAWTASHPA
jgi:putative hydrolase